MKISVHCLLIALLALAMTAAAQVQTHTLKPVAVPKNIYRADANASKEIKEAVTRAKSGNKRVMLVFGGNWCYDCHVLDAALRDPAIAPTFTKYYELVHVDVGQGERNGDLVRKYKINLEKGVPAISLLDSTGKLIFTDKGGEFQAARRMTQEDLVAFLEKWKSR
jgi:thiol:disulfide interchange protein